MPRVLNSRWRLAPVVVDTELRANESVLAHDIHSPPSSRKATSTMVFSVCGSSSNGHGDRGEDDELSGRTLWDCTKVLYDLVADPTASSKISIKGKHVIELGAGTGALSIGIARAGAASVTCTDLSCHLERIRSTIEANGWIACTHPKTNCFRSVGGASHKSADIVVAALRWGDHEDLQRLRASASESNTTARSTKGGKGCGSCKETGNITAEPIKQQQQQQKGDGVKEGTVGAKSDPDRITSISASVGWDAGAGFDMIVLSEVLYWPALDFLQEDTREPLRHTLVTLSKPDTVVILVYKERWPEREREFLESCEESFQVHRIPPSQLGPPQSSTEDPGFDAMRAVFMTRTSPSPHT